jgi:hypothetical protein
MTLAEAKARANETFIVQVQLTIVTYYQQNIFILHATGSAKMQATAMAKVAMIVWATLGNGRESALNRALDGSTFLG